MVNTTFKFSDSEIQIFAGFTNETKFSADLETSLSCKHESTDVIEMMKYEVLKKFEDNQMKFSLVIPEEQIEIFDDATSSDKTKWLTPHASTINIIGSHIYATCVISAIDDVLFDFGIAQSNNEGESANFCQYICSSSKVTNNFTSAPLEINNYFDTKTTLTHRYYGKLRFIWDRLVNPNVKHFF